jgi:O-antigen ligase
VDGGRALTGITPSARDPRSWASDARRFDAVDLAGAALLAATIIWVAVTTAAGRGDAVPAILLLSASAITLVVARSITRLHRWFVPFLVWAAVALCAASAGPGLAAQDPLGYANASAALFFLATAAALMVFARCSRPLVRIGSLWAAVAAGVLPWIGNAQAAAVLVCILPLPLIVPLRHRGVRLLLAGGALAVCSTLGATILLGLAYHGHGTGLLHTVVDATLTERRVQMWHDALSITRSSPALGIGPRRFRLMSPTALAHQDQPEAHSEYLQMAAETGLVGLALCLGLALWGFTRLWVDPSDAGTAVAAIAFTGVGIHAGIDYILHFPAVLIAAAALLGAGSVTRSSDIRARPPEDSAIRRGQALAAMYSVGLALVLVAPFEALHPSHFVINGAVLNAEGVRFTSAGLVETATQASDLYNAVSRTGHLTVELWAKADRIQQSSAAWLVSNSRGPSVRNFTVGQSGLDLIVRLRTTETNINGTSRELDVKNVFVPGRLQHLAVTFDGQRRRVYVDGRLRLEEDGPGGSPSGASWDSSYPLLLGNEVGGDRPWLGSLLNVTVSNQALSGAELRSLYEAGPLAFDAAEPLVRYRLDGRILAPDLHVPARLQAPQADFVRALLRIHGSPLVALLLAGLFLPFGLSVRASLGPGTIRTAMLVVALGLALALAAEFSQHLQSRTSSIINVASAGVGAGLGVAGWTVLQRRSRPQ